MNELHFSWLVLLVLVPAAGALVSLRCRSSARAHTVGTVTTVICVLLAAGAWIDLAKRGRATDPFIPPLFLDDLSAPLLLCAALMVGGVHVTTPRARRNAVNVAKFLGSEAILLMTFSTADPWVLAALFMAGTVLPWSEVRSENPAAARVFAIYMVAGIALFVLGILGGPASWGSIPLAAAIFIRKGIIPLHSWMPSFFQTTRTAVAILFAMPQVGTYCAARLLVPSAPAGVLTAVGIISLITAVYAAALALVQKDARRMFGFFFMSQSAIVLAGLQCDNVRGLAGGLTLWISSILSMSGLGITLRALEARRGMMSLARFHGGYERMQVLAASFMIFGLACVGIPGTMGFIAEELLVDGAVQSFPIFGMLVAVAAALNGVTVLKTYWALFCGAPAGPWPERMRLREWATVLGLVTILLVGGVWPGPLVRTEASAAATLLSKQLLRDLR